MAFGGIVREGRWRAIRDAERPVELKFEARLEMSFVSQRLVGLNVLVGRSEAAAVLRIAPVSRRARPSPPNRWPRLAKS
jgi:hypothetical protein